MRRRNSTPTAMISTSPSGSATPSKLDTGLVELAQAALLRPLVAEHRAAVEIFQRQCWARPPEMKARATLAAVPPAAG
jgi:hypothetical protein